jgi:hypothetical protein
MRYRPHREPIDEAQAVEVDGRSGLIAHLCEEYRGFPVADIFHELMRITPYSGFDERTGWEQTHAVIVGGYGVFGFCDGPAELT